MPSAPGKPSVQHRSSWGSWVVLLVLVLWAALGAAGCGQTKQESASIKALKPNAATYAKASGKPVSSRPHVRGRIVTINVKDREIAEDVYTSLPTALQARFAKEVSTVVKIKYGKTVLGHYATSGDAAVQQYAELTIVDMRSHVQYRHTIDGPEPPSSKRASESGTADKPEASAIARYLVGLPHLADRVTSTRGSNRT